MTDPIRVGHYELLEPIGEGGMGIVYRARDPRLDRIVAIKFLSGAASLDPSRRARFLREARAEAALAHPNIATVLDVGETVLDHPSLSPTSSDWGATPLPKIPYLVLEYVPGTDLRAQLRQGPLPSVEALRIARQIAAGLAAAHAAGIVHRDLKPANVRLTPDGLVKILDFGLARFLEPQTGSGSGDDVTELSTREGAVMGTLPYMAPEQAAGQLADARADLFAFGVMLFEMVTGRRPFHGDTTMQLLRAVLSERAERIDPAAIDCSPRIAELVDRLLAKEPDERPRGAKEVLHELDEIARDYEQQRTTVSRVSKLSREISGTVARTSRPLRVVLVASALLGIAAVTVLLMGRGGDAPATEPAAPIGFHQLAVLPFVNATGDPANDYVAEGLGPAMVGQLAAAPGISVASYRETLRYRQSTASARDVARELGVGALLEATLRSGIQGLALDATLTDGQNGRVFWTRSLPATNGELAGLTAQLSEAAVEALSVPLTAEDRARLARDPTGSAAAFDLYLRGQSSLENYEDPQSSRIAAGYFERATQLDPQFALAYARGAWALARAWDLERDPALLERADALAARALEIDHDLPESRLAAARLAILRNKPQEAIELLEPYAEGGRAAARVHSLLSLAWETAGDAEKAERHLLRTVETRGTSWFHWNDLGDFRLRTGNYPGARDAFERAAALVRSDNRIPQENLASVLYSEGHYDEALAAYEALPRPFTQSASYNNLAAAYFAKGNFYDAELNFRQAIRLAPREAMYRRNLADTLLRLGRLNEAREAYAQALRLVEAQLQETPGDLQLLLERTLYLARAERCPEALAEANRLARELAESAGVLHWLARPAALCGDPLTAVGRLERAVALGFPTAPLAVEDELAALRGRADFEALVGDGER